VTSGASTAMALTERAGSERVRGQEKRLCNESQWNSTWFIVGGGPAGPRCRNQTETAGPPIRAGVVSVCLIEKGRGDRRPHLVGARSWIHARLTELFPTWKQMGAPLNTEVSEDHFVILYENGGRRIPNSLLPDCFIKPRKLHHQLG